MKNVSNIISTELNAPSLDEEDESGSVVVFLSVRFPNRSSIIATILTLIAMMLGIFVVY